MYEAKMSHDNFEYLNLPTKTSTTQGSPGIREPKIIGYFSVNGERNYIPSADNLKYIKLPQVQENKNIRFDLNQGYEQVIRKPESARHENLDQILKFIINNKGKFLLDETEETDVKLGKDKCIKLNVDFVAFRGLLRLVMCTPYEKMEDWCILASKLGNTIYLCQKETEQKLYKRQNQKEWLTKILSYGFKFEQYLLSDNPEKDPNTDEPVNEAEEFCCIFETRLDSFKLCYGAEMDGIQSEIPFNSEKDDLNKFEFVELKSSLPLRENFWNFKARNWWCQSFLVGIRKIIVGLRNNNGIVNEIKEIEVKSLAHEGKKYWSANVCLDFLVRFLEKIKTIMDNVSSPYSVYQFEWHPSNKNKIRYKILEGKNNLSFLPEWYLKEMRITKIKSLS